TMLTLLLGKTLPVGNGVLIIFVINRGSPAYIFLDLPHAYLQPKVDRVLHRLVSIKLAVDKVVLLHHPLHAFHKVAALFKPERRHNSMVLHGAIGDGFFYRKARTSNRSRVLVR